MIDCKKEERILVIDGENLLHRSYWAAYPTWKDIKNEMYVYYFFNTLKSYVTIFHPSKIVCTWDFRDDGCSNERKSVLEDYKGNRVFNEEVHLYSEIIRQILDSVGITQIHPLNREADDIIYWLGAIKCPGQCSIVTTDTDMYQMVVPELEGNIIWNPKKKIDVNPIYLKTNFEVEDGRQFIIKKALRGDSSDNIVGIKGIRSTRIKHIIKVMNGNYDFEALKASGLLSEEHIDILKRNLDIMRLDKLVERPDEMEFYERQFNAPTKIDKEAFRTHMRNLQFLEVLRRFESWFKTLTLDGVKKPEKRIEYVDLLQD